MEDLLTNQETLVTAMEQLLSSFKKAGRDRKTADYVKRMLDLLEMYWKDFESNHSQLLEYKDKNVSYFKDKHYQQALEFYNNAKTHIMQSLPRSTTPIGTTKGGDNAFSTPGPSTSKTLPVPTFTSQGNASKLEEMLRKQKSNFKAFSRTISAIDLDNVTEIWEFEDILKTVQSRWSTIDSLHWEIDSNLFEENKDYEVTFNEYENQYTNIKKALNSKMWDVSHRERSTPKMDIPTFSGNYHQWLSFKDLFSEAIHTNKSLSQAQKMQFLKSKLRGEADKLVQHLRISSDNYQVCWDILNQRYNNTKLIFSSHINILLSLPTIQNQTAAQIKRLHDTTNECLNAVKSLGVDISNWDPLVVHILSQKLDVETHNNYIESLQHPRDLPTLHDFLHFLECKFTSLESSRRKPDSTKPSQQQHENFKKLPTRFPVCNNPNKIIQNKSFINHSTAKNSGPVPLQRKCPLCSNKHNLYQCKTFLEAKPDSRLQTIMKLEVCKNCLYNHNGKMCTSEKTCRHCNDAHNTLLHDAYVTSVTSDEPFTVPSENQRKFNACVSQDIDAESLLATAKIRVRAADGSFHTMRALIDPCAQSSLITENAAQRLMLPRKGCKWIVYGVGSKANHSKGVIEITASSIHNNFTFNTEAFVMKNMIHNDNLPHQTFEKPLLPYQKDIQLADPEFYISRPIDLILSVDVYTHIILPGFIRDKSSPHIAQQTQLGWIISGKCANAQPYHCNVVMMTNLEDIQRFWEIEDIADNSSTMSNEDQQCVLQYQAETRRQPDGRYVVRLPLKPDVDEKLGASKSKAVAQFHQLERKFTKNDTIAKRYKEFIDEYINLGHMHESTGNQTPIECYLPHHCVLREDSTTTSIRVVFNASAKTSTGNSLNDLMYRGPNLQQDLVLLIIKWRQYKVAFTADIEKMFRQILVHQDDQRYQKIIWRDFPNQPLREYQLSTVVYGTKGAPFLAMMTLKALAKDEGHRFPEAAKVVENSFYMDDLLHGHHDIESAKQLKSDLINLFKSGGFNLRKWTSNKAELLDDEIALDFNNQAFDFRHQETTKTLGLRWNPHDDQFSFQVKVPKDLSCKPTKRSLLSDISTIFDPLGWLVPVTVSLKLLFQESWLLDLKWDDFLPEDISAKWHKTRKDLDNINKIRVQRWLTSHKNDQIELHGFCDSSTKAYACVIYCKINKTHQSNNKNSSVVIIAAKSRLVPAKKTISLPRLELCAAHLLSKLMKTVKEGLSDYNIKLFGWSDSTAVLGWLNGNPDRWKPFVANRVKLVTEIMSPECWSYVKSGDNPADCASRGITADQLSKHPTWWKGPQWLSSYDCQKTKERPLYVTDEEVKKPKQINVGVVTKDYENDTITDLIHNHSNITRASRVLAWMLRMRSQHQNKPSFLTIPELRKAKHILIKHVQQSEFSDDIQNIQKCNQVNTKSKLFHFKPFIDNEGLLRVGGRIRNANIDEKMKHPLILPHNHHLTDMLIDQGHKMTYHGGARLTLAWLRQQYWILGGNNAVKKRLRNCVTCRRHDPVKQDQIMGDLPSARTNATRPFYHTGVDFTGFVDVKSSKGRGIATTKGYVAVFVCMATKAVHLELVSDLTASAFLAAFRRLAARRGAPRHVYSDNGTNFSKASRRLQEEFINLKSTLNDEFYTELTKMEIEWHFNAPSWPSAGGLWEAAVKSLKYHLRRVIGEQKLTYEEFSTLLAQIEGCLNSRPLCALSEDPDDVDYLTPSHFLSSGPVLTIIETERDERTRWQLTQKIYQDIWKRWRSEYLTQITARSKWQKPKRNLEIDDVVLIHDANLPAGKWALGRVVKLHPGKDGYVRVVTVKTKNGNIKRPVVKLSILPTSNQTNHLNQPSRQSNDQNASNNNIDSDAKPQTKRYTRKGTCYLITMALTLFMLFISPAQCMNTYNVSSLNKNQSIYFYKVSNMHYIGDQLKLTVYSDTNSYWQGFNLSNLYLDHLANVCKNSEIKSHYNQILLQLHHGYTELEHNNKDLRDQQFTPEHVRVSRGLINAVGNVAQSLFDVLNDQFAEQYAKNISLIRSNQNHLSLLWKNQTSVVQSKYNFLKTMEICIDKQHKIFNHRLNSLEKSANIMNDEILNIMMTDEFASSSIPANKNLMNLKDVQDILLDTVVGCEHLVTTDRLSKVDITSLGEDRLINKQHSNDINLRADIMNIKIPTITNNINLSIPTSEINSESSNHEQEIKDLGKQIEQKKSETALTEQISRRSPLRRTKSGGTCSGGWRCEHLAVATADTAADTAAATATGAAVHEPQSSSDVYCVSDQCVNSSDQFKVSSAGGEYNQFAKF